MKGHEITTTVSHRITPSLGTNKVTYNDPWAVAQEKVARDLTKAHGVRPPQEYVDQIILHHISRPPGRTRTGQRRRAFAPRDGRTVESLGRVRLRVIVERVTDGSVRFKTPKGTMSWSVHKNKHALVPGDKVSVHGELKRCLNGGKAQYLTKVQVIP